jgi:hypothetical protein
MDEDPLFELAVYLVASARLMLEEPVVYGSFRLVEAAVRIIDSRSRLSLAPDAFLAEQRTLLNDGKLGLVEDPDGYAAWLDGVLRTFSAEAKARNLPERPDASSA